MAQYPIGQRYRGSGIEMPGIAGEAIPRGAAVYMSAVDGLWYLADADAVATLPVVGISLDQTAAGLVFQIVIVGIIGRSTWTWTRGDPIYVSGTPGVLTQVAPANLQPVAIALTTTDIYVNPGAAGASATCGILEGATAYVGFDACKEPFTNYFLADGVADNVTLQAALDYVQGLGGGLVLVERGVYFLDAQILIPSYTTLKGTGITAYNTNTTTLRLTDGVDDDMISNKVAAVAVGIENLYLIGNRVNQAAGSGINIDAVQSEIAFNHINDFKINGVIVNGIQTRVYRNFFDNIDQDAIQLLAADCYVYNNDCFGTRYGIYINAGSNHISENNAFLCGSHGIFGDTGSDESIISDNRANNCTGWGIDSVGSNNIVADNRCVDNVAGGIRIRSFDHVVSGNNCWENGGSGIDLTGSAQRSAITGNVLRENDGHGIALTDQEHISVTGNVIMNNGQGAVFRSGIFVFFNVSSRYITISGNVISDDQGGPTQRYGVRVDTGVTDVSVTDNIFEGNEFYGVWVETGAVDILVKNNLLLNNGTAAIQDDGTNTKLATKSFQFTEAVNGAIVVTSPTGVDVDAATEAALTWGQLPTEVQQVVRLKIWAVATAGPIGAGGQMHLEVTFNAGASNAAYNTAAKSWNIANFDGEEADYVADDVIHWVVEDGDVGSELLALAAGDSFEILAIYEDGADPDGATDALFRVVEVEYV